MVWRASTADSGAQLGVLVLSSWEGQEAKPHLTVLFASLCPGHEGTQLVPQFTEHPRQASKGSS